MHNVAVWEASQRSLHEANSQQLQLPLNHEHALCAQHAENIPVLQTEVIAWALEARQGSVRNTVLCNEMSTASVRYDALENEVQNANNQLMSSQSRYQTVLHEANSQTQRTAMLAEENNQLIERLEHSSHFHQSRMTDLAERYEHQLRDAAIRVQQTNLEANASILIGSPVPTHS